MKPDQINTTNKQNGAVLIISLVIMVAMTLIGITAMRTSILEEKMAGNMRDKEQAFQAAEATLRFAEDFIRNNVIATVSFDTDGADGFYALSDGLDNDSDSYERIWETIDWTNADSLEYSAFNSSFNIATPPRYVIQHMASIVNANDTLNLDNAGQGTGAGTIEAFLITVRATGGSDDSIVYLQSSYGKRL